MFDLKYFYLCAASLVVIASNSYGQVFPEVKSFVAPRYPAAAQAVRAEGDVLVAVTVDSKGDVGATEVITGHRLLGEAAARAADGWKFSPSPGTHYLTLSFRFRLPVRKGKSMVKLVGGYTLLLTGRWVEILQTTSYEASGSK